MLLFLVTNMAAVTSRVNHHISLLPNSSKNKLLFLLLLSSTDIVVIFILLLTFYTVFKFSVPFHFSIFQVFQGFFCGRQWGPFAVKDHLLSILGIICRPGSFSALYAAKLKATSELCDQRWLCDYTIDQSKCSYWHTPLTPFSNANYYYHTNSLN